MSLSLIERVTEAFRQKFHCVPTDWIQAPGRVNLIGEHTDYNDGFVLPCAINFQTVVAASRRDDMLVRVWAVDYQQADEFDLSLPLLPHPSQLWANYIRGVLLFLQQRGCSFTGMQLAISGNVPQGAGLSSSASLEVAIGHTVKTLFDLPLSPQEIALNGQQAENQFVGCQCGIMDQLISACGKQNHALLIDCRSLHTRAVSLPEDIVVMIVNSNKARGLVESEYNTRRQQCEQAAQVLGVKALRDVSLAQFETQHILLTPLTAQRARHVISENQRTLDAAEALAQGDLRQLSLLMAASHASMRHDFEITVPEIDHLVDIIQQVIGDRGGVRMTGGGFGGCVVTLLPADLVEPVERAIADQYTARTGLQATVYLCHPSAGAGIIYGEPSA